MSRSRFVVPDCLLIKEGIAVVSERQPTHIERSDRGYYDAPQPTCAPGASFLAALAYSDLFEYPLSISEIATFQVGTEYSLTDVQDWLTRETQPGGRVGSHAAYYCLAGREETVASRLRNAKASVRPWKRAHIYAGWLARLPFVRMIAV